MKTSSNFLLTLLLFAGQLHAGGGGGNDQGYYAEELKVSYPGDCIFVFDPEFEEFCDGFAQQLAADKNDPWVLGHFSDNELPLPADALRNFLNLPDSDAGHQAAWKWWRARRGAKAREKDIKPEDSTAACHPDP